MSSKTKLVWKEEDNAEINKVLKTVNLVLAFCTILTPLIVSFVCLFGVEIDFANVLIIIFVSFIFIKIFSFCFNWRFIRFRKLDILEILSIALFVMFCVAEIINGMREMSFIFTLGYFIIFTIFVKVDKKHYKALLYTFILTLTACSIMGVCDLNNSYMPGFVDITFPMSMQFWNPNYSAYITVMAIIMTMYVLSKYKSKLDQIVFWVAYVVLNVALFINGCFSAETAMFIAQLFLIIYLWIKNKKCPYLMFIFLGISIASSFVWIKGVSTSCANYMFEALAVIDDNLGTNLLKGVSIFFDKLFGTGVLEGVAGSDGWARADNKIMCWRAITESAGSVLFGHGTLYNNNILVHNVFLEVWLEYGLINLALYCAIVIIVFVRLFKTKFTSYNIYLISLMIAVLGVCHYFGGVEWYSYPYFMCFFAVLAREVNEKYALKKKNQETGNDGKTESDLEIVVEDSKNKKNEEKSKVKVTQRKE